MARYTAQEMREMATEAEVIEVADQFFGHDMDTIAAMLRQAADELERERKYEYKVLYRRDGCLCEAISHSENIQSAMEVLGVYSGYKDAHIVRREVGEWEDAK